MKTIQINLSDQVSDDMCREIKDQALQLAIDRLAQGQHISYPEAAAQIGLAPEEADRLIDGMEWLNDPLIQDMLLERAEEAEAERERGELKDWEGLRRELGL